MYINLNSIIHYPLSVFRENATASGQSQKILAIVAIAFAAFVAGWYVATHCCFKVKEEEQNKPEEKPDELTVENEIDIDTIDPEPEIALIKEEEEITTKDSSQPFREYKVSVVHKEVYVGDINNNGFLNGEGIKTGLKGTAAGEFKHGALNGRGWCTGPHGSLEEGVFENGLLQGKGRRICPGQFHEIVYEPGRKYSKWHEYGKIEEGNFLNGELHGSGKRIHFIEDKTWEGKFKKGELRIGKVTFKDGKVEEGLFENGSLIKEREILTLNDGSIADGIFEVDGQGQGKITRLDGTIEEGKFWRCHLMGRGKKIRPNGEIEEGKFTNGLLKGPGKRCRSDGTIEVGEFNLGGIKQGTITYTNNKIEEGEFDDLFHRIVKGKRTLPNKTVEEGEFNEFGTLVKGKRLMLDGTVQDVK
jgi:hypothetical protein